MSSVRLSGRGPGLARRVALWTSVLLLGALLLGLLPSAFAALGDSPAEAIPVGPNGRFTGTTPPQRSTWFVFHYQGGDEVATISVEQEPADATNTDLVLQTGSPQNLRREPSTATRSGNTLTQTFSDPNSRDVFIQFVNNQTDRTVSFAGQVTPTSVLATPAPGTVTPTPGPVAGAPQVALTVGADGTVAGTLGPRQAVWFRFFYGNPGADTTVSVSIAPSADGADLGLFTGPDPNSLTPQAGAPARAGDTLSRRVNLPNTQFVFFSVANNNDALIVAYSGRVTPIFPTPTPLVTATPTATSTAAPTATATAPASPTATPQPAPLVPHDARFFTETRFRIDNDAIFSLFNARGQIDIFGFPVSRTFTLLGCQVQVFQRQIAQVCAGRGATFMNLLDPDIFPFTRVNFSTFPAVDEGLKAITPKVSDPNYATAILDFVRANAPDTFEGVPVNFGQTFFNLITPDMAGTSDPGLLGLINLEAWGAPISRPARDPNNADFIYQRFQRGIMHHIASQRVTRGILLADFLKQIMRDSPELPPDLREQAQGSRFFHQYCPGAPGWLCRPNELPATDLTFAFEVG